MIALPILGVAGEFPVYFVAVYVVGFVAAVFLGLVAWYNSKRPVGWERSQRPSFIPKINTGEDEGLISPMQSGIQPEEKVESQEDPPTEASHGQSPDPS